MAIGATLIIVILLPRADHQSYSYELNQPWKYALLTAEFDTPIMRDSASANALRDSIDRSFVTFVAPQANVQKDNVAKFRNIVKPHATAPQTLILSNILAEVYNNGIVDENLYNHIQSQPEHQLRLCQNEQGGTTIHTIDASKMLSPQLAAEYIDSIYNIQTAQQAPLTPEINKAIELTLRPNYEIDAKNDQKFRSQEYLTVNAAMGVIKKGQRIVDRGEIITPQIYTNLNTYLDMLAKSRDNDKTHKYFMLGQVAYILICFTLLFIFLKLYRRDIFDNIRKLLFVMTVICLFVIFGIVMFEYVPNGIMFVPFAAVPVVMLVFFDSRTAIFSLGVAVMISALVATFPFNFIFLELLAGLVATLSIHQLSRRSQLLRTGAFTFIAYAIGQLAMYYVTEGTLDNYTWRMVGVFAINSILLSFTYLLIFILEKIFGFTSTVTLVELSDINSPLLRQLQESAPGTFQHSMQVSALGAEAARAIGANTTLVRTGALYHDIGKMKSPVFFTENQHGVNPHEGLDPETSAKKIISHVTDGLQMAKEHKLPAVIRDFISQHHGKGITRYFYNTAVNNSKDGNVDITKFQYPGPNPQSRETAILMMADAVEAASRSLSDYSAQSIDRLVDNIIDSQMNDGLFKDAPISLRDIEMVKNTFKKRLSTIYHSRVAYPTLQKKPTAETES